ncbi:hypothetical protein TSOC_003701 [Tetrabaena socialis]|uniref:Uncharacterized protein n=1 Tax=Tetrabaena socialis TaxID=47790 RepID=A0A2J8AAZ8_9CHLO|nr:hypothetical protein TSOC_003701 [Tetrabaena socialis]|eukprot:PNH09696.1 hypothetical protein TSOC_003701 [Tetrabaena socialis]
MVMRVHGYGLADGFAIPFSRCAASAKLRRRSAAATAAAASASCRAAAPPSAATARASSATRCSAAPRIRFFSARKRTASSSSLLASGHRVGCCGSGSGITALPASAPAMSTRSCSSVVAKLDSATASTPPSTASAAASFSRPSGRSTAHSRSAPRPATSLSWRATRMRAAATRRPSSSSAPPMLSSVLAAGPARRSSASSAAFHGDRVSSMGAPSASRTLVTIAPACAARQDQGAAKWRVHCQGPGTGEAGLWRRCVGSTSRCLGGSGAR